MAAEPVTWRRYPAEGWTDEHRKLARFLTGCGVDLADARPDWIESTVWVEDVAGRPHSLATVYTPAVTSCPPTDGTTHLYPTP